MRVAIVHDWLVTYAGAERVLEQMLASYPQADVFSLIDFMPPDERGFLGNRPVHTSFLQRLPGMRRGYRRFLPLMPLAIEQFDLSGYDLVLSSSYAVAKGVITGPDQLHFCLCHSPIRYAWDLQHQYLRETGLDRGVRGGIARWMLHRIRMWDARTANGVDGFIAVSQFVARRIWKVYRREATVIYPPVDVEGFTPGTAREDFYVTASRMVPYKRIDLIVEAFAAMPERRLVVIGDGPEARRIRNKGAANISFLGQQPMSALRDHLQRARAFVFAAEEDFGIAPVEAQACGTPVIAYGKGGVLESIRGLSHESPTGVFFDSQSIPAVTSAVQAFEREGQRITSEACRQNALRFAPERFRREFVEYVSRSSKQAVADRRGCR
ncbi:MAG TPA: glycosyltransferase family 4 protein [Gemmatimonadales bacterium]|nr:glycosyltransferase family 4 protein [Gemmatimonadales bacterium]